MLEQVGPKRFWQELKNQAPYYAKMLPDLPRLLHDYLQQNQSEQVQTQLLDIIKEQRRTNRILTSLLYACGGFLLGLVAMQVVIWIRIHFF
jgi:ubiquinone biosynthesis protein